MNKDDFSTDNNHGDIPYDNSIGDLGKIKFYESLFISVASNKLVSDSLKGKLKEDCNLKSSLFLAINKEVLEKGLVDDSLNSDEFNLIINRIEFIASEAEETVKSENFQDSSSNNIISFIRVLGELMLNSIKVLTNSFISDEGCDDKDNKLHHIKIQAKNDEYIWLFDIVGESVDYKNTTTYVNGILEPSMNKNAIIITAFLKFLAVYKAKELAENKVKQIHQHQ